MPMAGLYVWVSVVSFPTKAAIFGLPQTAIIIAATYRTVGGWVSMHNGMVDGVDGVAGWLGGWGHCIFLKGKHRFLASCC